MSHTTVALAARIHSYGSHPAYGHHASGSSGHHSDFLSRLPEVFGNAVARAFAWKSVGALFHGGPGLGFVVLLAAAAVVGFLLLRRTRRARS